MNQFCRTCGKTIVTENSLRIFSREGRQLLLCVRTIANCWLQNDPEFPCYMCADCQKLLRKVCRFRRRCAKIEKYLTRRKAKLTLGEGPASVSLQLPAQQVVAADDPLGIDELLVANEIKEEDELVDEQKAYEAERYLGKHLKDCSYEDDQDQADDYLPLQAEYGESETEAVHATAKSDTEPAVTGSNKTKGKMKANKQTMRLGRKLIHVKVIDDANPKRIVDRDSQIAKPCICEHCGRQFRDTSNLNVHLLRHTGTKPFECEICHQKCYTLHLLRRHQLKHTEGPYACTFCGLKYSTNSSRVRHEREACKKGRAPQSKWEIIKKGERTFHCEVCDLWFLRAGNFTQHIKSTSHIENERRKKRKTKTVQQKSSINT
ncbi:GL12565 [Drosophila persimilis]|uniref:GL12565 n=1 Tax=Drosophila persimilis TaxID=7234 RepID=B4GLG4_DROPE|nr:transcription factor Ouib [Drosophila persimilis]EDW38388.1 GL12565 [Drosophila persimilis]